LIIAEAVIALAALGLLALELAGAAGRVRLRGAGLFSAFVCYAVAVAAAFGAERLAAGDHPAPWLHAPLRAEVGETLVLVGVLGFATRIVARYWEWRGGIRYLSIAVVLLLGFGTFWLAIGAAEIAWLWLLPALLAAAAPRIRRLAPLAILGTLVTPVLVLAPPQLREAAWNGFLPSSLPLAAWLGLLLAPALATTSWWLRRPHGPLRTLLLPLGCALAIAAGVGLLFTAPDVCSASDFQRFHLACELSPTWR